MAKRRTKEQIHLQEIMEQLLYLHKCICKELTSKKYGNIYKQVNALLEIYFNDYFCNKNTIQKDLYFNSYSRVIEVKKSDLEYVLNVINGLKNCVKNNDKVSHFILEKTYKTEIQYSTKNREPEQKLLLEILDKKAKLDGTNKFNSLENKLVETNEKITNPPKKIKGYKVSLNSNFAMKLFDIPIDSNKNKTPYIEKPIFTPLKRNPDLKKIIQNFMVNYFLAFKGYHSIKICKYCKKYMAVELRTGQKRYCSDECKRAYNEANLKHPIERKKCKCKQNRWMNYYHDKLSVEHNDIPVNMKLDIHCKGCNKYCKGGKCIIINDKNPWLKYVSKKGNKSSF